MLTEQQRQRRQQGLGGSDMGALLGVSPWKTPYELYLEKTIPVLSEDKPTEQMNWGNWLEDGIAKGYEHISGYETVECDTMTHPEYPIFFAHPDRLIKGESKGLEVKNVGTWAGEEWGDSGSQKVPAHYFMQIAHYMYVTGYKEWDIAALFGGNSLRIYTFHHDKAFDDIIQEQGLAFWKNHVEKKMPPEPTFTKKSQAFLKQHYKNVEEKTVFLSKDMTKWKEVFLSGKEKMKKIDEEVKIASAHILKAMETADKAILTDGSYFSRDLIKVKSYQVPAREDVRLRYRQ